MGLTFAPTEQDRVENLRLQECMTEEMRDFSQELGGKYQEIAVLLADVKEKINAYIYRPIDKTVKAEKRKTASL